MVRALDHKLVRDLLSARLQLLSIIILSAMGVACFVGLASSHQNLKASRDAYFAHTRLADFWLTLKKAPVAVVDEVASLPGVAELRSRITFDVTIDLAHEPKPLTGRMISMPDERDRVLNNLVIIRGGYFTPQRPDEVILNDAFARARGVGPGDRLRIILNDRLQDLVVVGTAMSSEFVYIVSPGAIVPDPANYAILYVKRRFAEEATDMEGAFNELVGRLSPAVRDRPTETLQRLERRLDSYGVFLTTTRDQQASTRILSDEITQLRNSAILLPAIFLTVAAFVLNIMMTRLVDQQRTTIGTLKALGYTNRELLRHYLAFGLVVGLIGGLLGAAGGQGLAALLTRVYRNYFEFPTLLARLHPIVIIFGAAVSILFAVLGVWRGARAALGLNPAQAMRPKAPPVGKRVWFERFGWLWRRFNFEWRMTIRDIARQRMRTFAGLFAAAMGAALMLTAFGFDTSIRYVIDFQFEKLLLSDVDLALRDEASLDVVLEAERSLPGVVRAEPIFNLACTLRHGHREKRTSVTGLIPDATLTIPRDREGRAVTIPGDGLLLSRALADMLHARGGDTLTLTPIRGERRARPVRINAIVDTWLGLAAYAEFDYLNRLVGAEASVSAVQLETEPGSEVRLALYEAIKERPAVQTVSDVRDAKETLEEEVLQNLKYSVGVLIAFAGVIFFGSVFSASLISIADQQGRIGTMRALGYTTGEVSRMFLRNSLVVNLTGAVIGLPVGYGLMLLSIEQTSTEFFRFPLILAPWNVIVTLIFALAFTLTGHAFAHRQIRKLNWVEAMKVKE